MTVKNQPKYKAIFKNICLMQKQVVDDDTSKGKYQYVSRRRILVVMAITGQAGT